MQRGSPEFVRAPATGIAPRLLSIVLAGIIAPAVAGARGIPPESRFDARLQGFVGHLHEARSENASHDDLLAALESLYPGLTLSPDENGLVVNTLIELQPGLEERTIADLEAHGVRVGTRAGAFAAAAVPVEALENLEFLDGLVQITLTRSLTPSLDASRATTHAELVWGAAVPPYPLTGFTGRGTVIGIVDTGIDLGHPDFLRENGTTRIDFLWDQTMSPGPTPPGYGYGVEWTAASIDAGIANEVDTIGHGTHVAGIAAGSGVGTWGAVPPYTYVGVAPEAGLIVVKTTYTTSSVLDACSYIFARAGGRPCVINLSLGTQAGSHDTTDPFNRALDALTGRGRLIVASAGNEAGLGLHALLTLPSAGPDSVVFTLSIPSYSPQPGVGNDYLAIDGWYSRDDAISFVLQSPSGRRTSIVPPGGSNQTCFSLGGGEGRVAIYNNAPWSSTQDRNLYCEITDGSLGSQNCQAPRAGIWRIVAKRSGVINDGRIHLWMFSSRLGNGSRDPVFVNGRDETALITAPASASQVISVGATITKIQWQAVAGTFGYTSVTIADLGKTAPFSSPGPLRDGTIKPNLVAPGMGIASARSAAAVSIPALDLLDGTHRIDQGTSQAAPHVTGAIALIQQKLGPRTPAQIASDLVALSRADAITGPTPNNQYGWGRLNLTPLADPPVAISFVGVSATSSADGTIRLAWSVGSHEEMSGFHVHRSDAESGPFHRRTAKLLPYRDEVERTFEDVADNAGARYWYRIEAVTRSGESTFSSAFAVDPGVGRLQLEPSDPNPVTESTTIRFTIPQRGHVSLHVFDVTGAMLRTLLNESMSAGPGLVVWDGRDRAGNSVPAGLYVYQLGTPFGRISRKMIVRR